MAETRMDQAGVERDAQTCVTHFIPSVQLKGTRAEKLATLDLLIEHLANLRRSLAEASGPATGTAAADGHGGYAISSAISRTTPSRGGLFFRLLRIFTHVRIA